MIKEKFEKEEKRGEQNRNGSQCNLTVFRSFIDYFPVEEIQQMRYFFYELMKVYLGWEIGENIISTTQSPRGETLL